MRAKVIHAAKVGALTIVAIAISLVLWMMLVAIMFHDAVGPPG